MPEPVSSESKQDTTLGCLVRFLWTFAGNIALFFLAASMAYQEAVKLTWRDAAFWALIVVLIVIRFVDISYLHGKTADDKPATRSDWKRYVALLLGVALAVWLAVHGLAATGWLR